MQTKYFVVTEEKTYEFDTGTEVYIFDRAVSNNIPVRNIKHYVNAVYNTYNLQYNKLISLDDFCMCMVNKFKGE